MTIISLIWLLNFSAYEFHSQTPVAIGKWHKVEFRQIKETVPSGSAYNFSVYLNGKLEKSVINRDAREFTGVSMYASDRWSEAQKGSVRNFEVNLKKDSG